MMCNIPIATDADFIHIGDGVNVYPVYLSRAIIIWRNLNWLENIICFRPYFVNFLKADLGTHQSPQSVPQVFH